MEGVENEWQNRELYSSTCEPTPYFFDEMNAYDDCETTYD